jgi:hypothetical protein
MSISKIKRDSITADAVNETKIADDAISEEHLDNSVILDNTELSEVAASNDIFLVYDASSGTLKKILSSNVGITPPTFTSVSPTNVTTGDGTGNATFTITGTNFDATVTAKLRTTAGVDVNFDTVTRDSSTQITGVIAISSLSNANEPYDVVIINGAGLQVVATDQININAQPVYVTASGSLGTITTNTAGSFSVNATDPESAGNVTFELQSGSLPPGYSITNTAAEGGTAIISGTDSSTGSTTTFNFVLRAVDAASNTTSRAFSITSAVPVSESFTSSGTFSVPSYVSSIDVLVVAGGGGGGRDAGGGGGAGGLVFIPSYPVTPSGTVTVTVGCGGAVQTGNSTGNSGQNSVFGSPGDPGLGQGNILTAIAGGGGGGGGGSACPNAERDGQSGGSGGGGGGGNSAYPFGAGPSGPGPATQPTQPGQSGAYGFGNNGGTGKVDGICRRGAGGGGGAGAAGTPDGGGQGFSDGGEGGNGKAYTIADGTTPVYYAGGGGGSNAPTYPASNGARGGPGGQGGGGTGSANNWAGTPTGVCATAGQANKGGGGGGGVSCSGGCGEAGGKGIVIVRY